MVEWVAMDTNLELMVTQQGVAKRFFDLCFSLLALVVISPLFLLIFVAIRLTSKGKAIYVQERLGLGGKVFKCLKFRTMREGVTLELEKLQEWAVYQKLQKDPRVTPVGRWLRKTSLDELPQFWNVVRGELSVVGPRPYMVEQKGLLGRAAYTILSVKPGITGLWQTSGRSQTTFAERIALDQRYVETQTATKDFVLILKTFPALLSTRDAC